MQGEQIQVSARWRPIPVRTSDLSEHPTVDILLHGFGDASDYIIEQLDSVRPIEGLAPEPYDAPLVGVFTDAELDDVWLVSPGNIPDPVLRFDEPDIQIGFALGENIAANNHYIGLTGLFHIDPNFSNLPSSQVLWYRLQSTPAGNFRLLAQEFEEQGFHEETVDLGCYLLDGQEYIPLQGNFDADPQMEILCYSPIDNIHVLWSNIDGMLSGFALPCFPYASVYSVSGVDTQDIEAAKPFVGDFNGDGIDDVFWYLPGQTLVWLFGASELFGTSLIFWVQPVFEGIAPFGALFATAILYKNRIYAHLGRHTPSGTILDEEEIYEHQVTNNGVTILPAAQHSLWSTTCLRES